MEVFLKVVWKKPINVENYAVINFLFSLSRWNWNRSQWPSGLRRGSAADRFLGLRVRIPPRTRMSVSCERCVSSGRERSLLWTDPSSRGVLPTVMCHCVSSGNLKTEATVARVGLLRQRNNNNRCNWAKWSEMQLHCLGVEIEQSHFFKLQGPWRKHRASEDRVYVKSIFLYCAPVGMAVCLFSPCNTLPTIRVTVGVCVTSCSAKLALDSKFYF